MKTTRGKMQATTGDGSLSLKRKDDGGNFSGKPNKKITTDLQSGQIQVSIDDYDINIKTPSGKILSLKVKGSDTIGSLKLKIFTEEHIPFEQQELFFSEMVLENINTLANLHIKKGSTVKVMQKSVEMMEIFVNTFTGKTISLIVKPTDNIFHVKSMIKYKEDILCEDQALIFNNAILGDNGTLFNFHINTKETLTLMHKSKGLTRYMNIFVNIYTKKTITLNVKPSDTIESIKSNIKDLEDIPCDEQELVFNAEVLHNKDTLAEVSINNESTLTLMHVSSGIMHIFIENCMTGKTIIMDVKPSDTIYRVKVKLYNKEGIRPCEQSLVLDARRLQENATLADYDILNESTIDLLIAQRGC